MWLVWVWCVVVWKTTRHDIASGTECRRRGKQAGCRENRVRSISVRRVRLGLGVAGLIAIHKHRQIEHEYRGNRAYNDDHGGDDGVHRHAITPQVSGRRLAF